MPPGGAVLHPVQIWVVEILADPRGVCQQALLVEECFLDPQSLPMMPFLTILGTFFLNRITPKFHLKPHFHLKSPPREPFPMPSKKAGQWTPKGSSAMVCRRVAHMRHTRPLARTPPPATPPPAHLRGRGPPDAMRPLLLLLVLWCSATQSKWSLLGKPAPATGVGSGG